MKLRSLLLAAVAAFGLVGSPAMAAPTFNINDLLSAPITELANADKDALAHNDKRASQCYEGTIAYLETLPGSVPVIVSPGPITGPVTAFQDARDVTKVGISVVAQVKAGGGVKIPEPLIDACGPLALDVQNDLGTIVQDQAFFGLSLFHTALPIIP